jgi:putative FmdB family regulatory protein
MPIYEYRCPDCRKRQSIFFRSLAAVETAPACPECGNRHLLRIISRTAQVLSEDTRLERLSDDSDLSDVDENDPTSMARWARKMGQQMGDEEMGDDFDQVVDEMQDGGPPPQSDLDDEP